MFGRSGEALKALFHAVKDRVQPYRLTRESQVELACAVGGFLADLATCMQKHQVACGRGKNPAAWINSTSSNGVVYCKFKQIASASAARKAVMSQRLGEVPVLAVCTVDPNPYWFARLDGLCIMVFPDHIVVLEGGRKMSFPYAEALRDVEPEGVRDRMQKKLEEVIWQALPNAISGLKNADIKNLAQVRADMEAGFGPGLRLPQPHLRLVPPIKLVRPGDEEEVRHPRPSQG